MPRILSLLDRNPFSKTYGCFDRGYWFHRTSDFPASINQMGTHTLALLWKHPFDGKNPYYHNPKILNWCLAAVRFWMKCQHKDGSFDEWYPNERGWAGPTGYLVHAMAQTYFLLHKDVPHEFGVEFKKAIHQAGKYLASYDEEYVLANHHAIALLPIYEAYLITEDAQLLKAFEHKFSEFETYCHPEGWALEYDGVDIGYLAGTISFLTSLYKLWPDERIAGIVERAVQFTSYHLYPNGHFGGSMGSRQTVHFYHSGYEFWSHKIPMAATMAEMALQYLNDGQLVPPSTQEDHYVLYRLSEYLEASLAYQLRPMSMPLLPWQDEQNFTKFFKGCGVTVRKQGNIYAVANLNKGGVVKAFDIKERRMIANNSGWMARLENGRVVTSQWNDPSYQVSVTDHESSVKGKANFVVAKVFTPLKMIIFRIFMLMFGWHSVLAYQIKAGIRRLLMVGSKRSCVNFERKLIWSKKDLTIEDQIQLEGKGSIEAVYVGDEFPVRFVPQSRYFQLYELTEYGRFLSKEEIASLNTQRTLTVTQIIPFSG